MNGEAIARNDSVGEWQVNNRDRVISADAAADKLISHVTGKLVLDPHVVGSRLQWTAHAHGQNSTGDRIGFGAIIVAGPIQARRQLVATGPGC